MAEQMKKRLREMLVEKFPVLVQRVRKDHAAKSALVGTGHDFSHALMVAQYCLMIADDPLATMAWPAAICHNTDRLFPDDSEEFIEKRVRKYFELEDVRGGMDRDYRINFSDKEVDLIIEAVMCHSHRPSENDNSVTVVLMDADKLANIGSLLALRSAQFQPNLPIVDLRYLDQRPPGTSFKKPGSIYWDIKSSLEWAEPGWIRTPKAKDLAKPLFEELQIVLDGVVRQYENTGLVPYPFPEDFIVK